MSELLIASDPKELVREQTRLIESVKCKIHNAIDEAASAKMMSTQMRDAGMDVKPATRLHKRATERVHFLTKVQAALESGYVMMPDMPGEVIAVRTDMESPEVAGL